ncbi:hypothetical protein [Streptomyces sp. NPDC056188]|uniref:hypothetical protein n=1 Tax=Streptomyces sp. NPDC056188 TaxID=3345740 RepID=UPI0035DCB986
MTVVLDALDPHASNAIAYLTRTEPAMTSRPAAPLPTSPDALADRILTAGDAGLIEALAAQIGRPAARRALAEAHSIASDRLWHS